MNWLKAYPTLVVAAVIVSLFGLLIFFHGVALRNASLSYVYRSALSAHSFFLSTGNLTNPAPEEAHVFPYTNRIRIGNQTYDCVLGMTWNRYGIKTSTVVAVTLKGDLLWIDRDMPAKWIKAERYKAWHPPVASSAEELQQKDVGP